MIRKVKCLRIYLGFNQINVKKEKRIETPSTSGPKRLRKRNNFLSFSKDKPKKTKKNRQKKPKLTRNYQQLDK